MRVWILALCFMLASGLVSAAHASPFDGWTLEQLKAHPRFVPLDIPITERNAMTFQREWNSPDAPLTHKWIGYIVLSQHKSVYPLGEIVAIDDQGATSTFVDIGYWTPKWAVDAIDYLIERGVIQHYGPCG